MTGMEHAIKRAIEVLDAVDRNHDLDSGDLASSEEYARALAEAGLLAPAPLREEWGTRFGSSEYVHFGTGVEYPFFFKGDPPKGVNVRRCVTDWTPDRAEGDGRVVR